MNPEDRKQDRVNKSNIWIIMFSTALVVSLWMLVSWLTGTWPKSLKCESSETFFNGKCYQKEIMCIVENWTWSKFWEWNDYSECKISSCSVWFELVDNACLSETRKRLLSLSWSIIVQSHTLWSYPQIKINDTIQSGLIKMTIDFQELYKDGHYDGYLYGKNPNGTITNPQNFALSFFLGKENQWSFSPYTFGYGGFFNVLSQGKNWPFVNNNNLWLNGLIPWNQIVGWYTWSIPIENGVIFATNSDERTENYQYKRLNLLDYINNSVWLSLYIGWYLSNMASMQWWKFTEIKSIEIEYIGKANALQFVE